jgi:hypothetical protein
VIARSILQMRDAHPEMFCPGQVWYDDEPFAHIKLPPIIGLPTHLLRCTPATAPEPDERTDAVLLVGLYLRYPMEPIFRDYLLCADFDRFGQEVYIGGIANGRGMEIHRVVKFEGRMSVPLWR